MPDGAVAKPLTTTVGDLLDRALELRALREVAAAATRAPQAGREALREVGARLENLAAERQTAAEKLTEELAKSGAMKEKYDFSKASSRESSSADGGSASSSAAATAGSMEFVDPLLSFVQKAGSGSGRINQSYKDAGPASDGGIAAANRIAVGMTLLSVRGGDGADEARAVRTAKEAAARLREAEGTLTLELLPARSGASWRGLLK